MAIESERQLADLVFQLRSLSDEDRFVIMSTANYSPEGRLRGLYIRSILQRCPRDEALQFFTMAGVFVVGFGGAQLGDRVYPDHYPTGGRPPCVPRDGYSCWVPASDTWQPN
jgi:hypothetical protein